MVSRLKDQWNELVEQGGTGIEISETWVHCGVTGGQKKIVVCHAPKSQGMHYHSKLVQQECYIVIAVVLVRRWGTPRCLGC